jgi:sugar diacid utilization regulator
MCERISTSGSGSDSQILGVVADEIAAVNNCRVAGVYRLKDGDLDWVHTSRPEPVELRRLVRQRGGAAGSVRVADGSWTWVYALHGSGQEWGSLVICAPTAPSEVEETLIAAATVQAGAALVFAGVRRALDRESLIDRVLTAATERAMQGGGEQGIVDAVYGLSGHPVQSLDQFGRLSVWAGPADAPPLVTRTPAEYNQLCETLARTSGSVRYGQHLVAYAVSRGEPLGVLAMFDPDHHIRDEDGSQVLDRAVLVLATELVHKKTLAAIRVRLGHDLVDDMLDGDIRSASTNELVTRARALGHDLREPYRALAVRWIDCALDDGVIAHVTTATRALGMTCLTTRREDTLIVLVCQLTTDAWNDPSVWNVLHDSMARALRRGIGSIGIGGVAEVASQVPRSYRQALQALRVRTGSVDPHGVTNYDDMGLYRLFVGPDADVTDFVREWLGPLIDYDRDRAADLTETLAVYLEQGGNYDKTAKALLIHRSTLRYRLQRIRDIITRDLSDTEVRLNLDVAVRIWRVHYR